jgi:hypothetical protein
VQAKGSLQETSLGTLLEGAQSERATGTLTVRNDGQSYTLYFLFGHLFHANGEGATGDDAVLGALRWHDGEFAFDPKAKLPADETVKGSVAELVAKAGDENGAAPAAESKEAPRKEPEPEPAPKAEKQHHEPPPEREEKSERKGVKHRPQPKSGREPIPVPAGEIVYDSLKTSFVDFPRLITTLENEAYTGYVRLLTEGASGLILFREGTAQECVFDPGDNFQRGREALLAFNDEVTHGHGVLDVVGLPEEIVDGLYDLVVARPLYAELYASWVDMPALLDFLKDRKLTGSVLVRAEKGTGVIVLTDGSPTGAYTSESRGIEKDPKVVLDLCSDKGAMIEVKATDNAGGRPALNVDEIVGSRGGARRGHASPPPPPEPLREAPTEPAGSSFDAEVAPTTSFAALETGASAAETTTLPTYNPGSNPPPPAPPTPTETPAPAPTAKNVNWDSVVEDLQGMADRALGARSRKVKDLLGSAERSQAGVEQAVSQVSQISLLFVDSALLVKLEQDMRARLQSYL